MISTFKKLKIQISFFTLGLLTGGNTSILAQQISLNAMQDIRQITESASFSKQEIIRQDKGVTLSSRWLMFRDTLKTREISSHFVVKADIQSVLVNLMQPEKILAWNVGLKSMVVLKREGNTWITHDVYDIPYPLSKQDMVVQNQMITENNNITILLSALPDYIEPVKNVSRQQLYFAKWELIPMDKQTTEVKFSAISFSRSGIPRFIRDPIIHNSLFQSFLRLSELSATEAKVAGGVHFRQHKTEAFLRNNKIFLRSLNDNEKSGKNNKIHLHHTR